MRERWTVTVYDDRDERGNQVASRSSEPFANRKQAETYRDGAPEFERGIIEELPAIDDLHEAGAQL
jgi:hypothetical protein